MQLRKLAASALGAIMTGATLAFPAAAASLANYPAPFMENGNANFSIVLGDQAAAQDVVGAVEIAATLGGHSYTQETAEAGSATQQWSATDGSELNTENTDIYFTQTLDTARSTLTSDKLSILESGTVENVGGSDYDYDQYIDIGSRSTKISDSGGDLTDSQPIIDLGTSKSSPTYTAKVTFPDPMNITEAENDDASINLFGKSYTVSTDSDFTSGSKKLVLYGGQETATIEEGGSGSVSLGGTTIDLSVDSISGTDTANVEINGDLKDGVSEDDTFSVSGIDENVRIDTIVYRGQLDYGNRGKVIFSIGSQKLTLKNANTAAEGEDDTSIDNTNVTITKGDGQELSKLTVDIAAQDSDTDHVAVGESFEDPVFGTFNLAFEGTSPAKTADSRSTLSFGTDSDDEVKVDLTHESGDSQEITWIYNESSGMQLEYDSSKPYEVVENAGLAEDDRFIVNQGDFTHLLEVKTIDSLSSSSNKVKFSDVFTGDTYSATTGTTGQSTLYIDGQKYYVNNTGGNGVNVTWGSGSGYMGTGSGVGDEISVFPYILDENDAKVALTKPSTSLGDPGSATSPNWNVTLPTGTVDVDIQGNQTANDDRAVSFSSDVLTITEENGSETGNAGTKTAQGTVGQVQYNFTASFDSSWVVTNLSVTLTDQSGTALSDPALLVIEEADDSDNKNAVVVTPRYDSGNSEAEIAAPAFTGTSDNGQLDNDDKIYMDLYGTYVEHDADDYQTLDIYYPDSQATVGAAFLEEGGSLSASAGGQVTYNKAVPIASSVARLDTDVAEPSAVESDLILVGGPCANTLVQQLAEQNATDVSTCDAWSSDTPEIQLVENAFTDGQTALVVAGMNAEDTLSAARELQRDFENNPLPDQATLNV